MGIRISWSIYEQVFLLDMLQKILIGQLDRKQAIKDISGELRELAIQAGLEIDDKYRNENGIAMQLSKLEYIYTDKKSGFPTESGWFFDVVDLYRNHSDNYKEVLQEVLQKVAANKIEKDEILSNVDNEDKASGTMAVNEEFTDDMGKKYSVILAEYFPDGLQLRTIHLDKFRWCFFQKYGEEIREDGDRLRKELRTIGTLRENRIYAKKPQVQNDIINRMTEDIEAAFDSGAHCVYVEKLWERYQQELALKLRIYNEEALADLLKANEEKRYSYSHGYLKKANSDGDYKKDVLSVLKNSFLPITYNGIQQELWYIPLDKIKDALLADPALVNVGKEAYFYAPNFPINEEELHTLQNAMQKEIEDVDFLSGEDLRKLIEKNCPAVAIDIDGFTDWGLRNIIGYLLCDQFDVNGALLCKKGTKSSVQQIYLDFCKKRKSISLRELKEISEKTGTAIAWKVVMHEMIRVSKSDFMRKDQIVFNIETTDMILDSICGTRSYIPIHEIGMFLQFPGIGIPWNGFVLESYLMNFSKRFQLLQAGIAEGGYYGVMVRKGSEYQSYQDVVIDALAHSNEWEDEKTALAWIVQNGYQARKRWSGFDKILKEVALRRMQKKDEKE